MDRHNPQYLDNLKAATARLFQSRDGEVVLGFLKDQYLMCRFKDETIVRQAGRRDVVLAILDLMEASNERTGTVSGRSTG